MHAAVLITNVLDALILLCLRSLGEGEPGQDTFKLAEEPAASAQKNPESLQMDILGECTGKHLLHLWSK